MEKKNLTETQRVHNLIIVDESGSMECIRHQAFTGMNETLQSIRMAQEQHPHLEQLVSLVSFSTGRMQWHYRSQPALATCDLPSSAYHPAGGTPLYDAIGSSVSWINGQMASGDKALVTIITDGEENSSVEWRLPMVKNLIEKLKTQGWVFTLIGADSLDVEGMGRSLSIKNNLRWEQSDRGTKQMFAKLSESRCGYFESLATGEAEPEDGNFFK